MDNHITHERAPSMMADDKPFRFLDLPAELRNNIYELVAADSVALYNDLDGSNKVDSLAPFARICRKIRQEFLGVLTTSAGTMTFRVVNLDFAPFMRYFSTLSDANLASMNILCKRLGLRMKLDISEAHPQSMTRLLDWINFRDDLKKSGKKLFFYYQLASCSTYGSLRGSKEMVDKALWLMETEELLFSHGDFRRIYQAIKRRVG